MEWLKHAFATDSPGPAHPNDAQRLLVDRLCREIVRRRLATPAQMALEMGRPLNYVSAQAMHFFQPFLAILGDTAAYEQFSSFLEQRGSIDYIGERLAAIEAGEARRAGSGGPEDQARPTSDLQAGGPEEQARPTSGDPGAVSAPEHRDAK